MKISLYSLVLPILSSLALFSSKARFPDYELTIFLSWGLFLTCSCIFLQNIKYKTQAFILVLILVGIRIIIALVDLPSMVRFIYLSGSFIVMVFAGLSVFLKIPQLLLKQIYWLAGISVVISLLQINGVIWAQKAGSGVEDKRLSAEKVIFQDYEAVESVGLLQTRPDGFTHANNLTSQLLLLFYALCFFYYTVETGLPRASMFGLFLISLAGALSGGKVIVLGIFLVYTVSFCLRRVKKIRVFCAAGITAGAYMLYSLIFPGLFILNFNMDLFALNASGRIINFGVMAKTDMFIPLAGFIETLGNDRYIQAGSMLAQNNKLQDVSDGFSGIAVLADTLPLPVLLIAALAAALIWKSEAWRLEWLHIYNLRSGSVVVSAALLASVFGGPFYQTVWFTFFSSLAIAPLLCRFFNDRFIQSVSRHRF